MTGNIEREDDAYYNFVTEFRREHKRFPRAEEAWQARATLSQPAAGGAVGVPKQDIDLAEYIRSTVLADQEDGESSASVSLQGYDWSRVIDALRGKRATATPDESRELALIEFVINDLKSWPRSNHDANDIRMAFNESRKR